MLNQQSFTPRKIQSEDNRESTDDGLDLFTDIKFICQHRVSGYVCCV